MFVFEESRKVLRFSNQKISKTQSWLYYIPKDLHVQYGRKTIYVYGRKNGYSLPSYHSFSCLHFLCFNSSDSKHKKEEEFFCNISAFPTMNEWYIPVFFPFLFHITFLLYPIKTNRLKGSSYVVRSFAINFLGFLCIVIFSTYIRSLVI